MYTWSVFIHLIIACFWMGGMLFTAAILVPAARNKLAEHRGLLFIELGTRFSRLSWFLFPVLIATGITALLGKGITVEELLTINFWQSRYGSTLFVKLIFFSLVLIVSGLHDFWLGPKAASLLEKGKTDQKTDLFRKASSWGGRVNLILGLIIIYFAVSLVRW